VSKLSLTFEADDLGDLIAQLRLALALLDDPGGPHPVTKLVDVLQGVCPSGHGAMRRIAPTKPGQSWPPFYKCDTCGNKQEIGA
jgi:hypothetical protein